MAKVRCRDCRVHTGSRCEFFMKYTMPDKLRYCRKFQAKTQTLLIP